MRYGWALWVIACYLVSFFIPLLTVTPSGGDGGGVSAVLKGGSPFDLHYLSIGVFPFLLSSIFHSLLQWQLPQLLAWVDKRGMGADAVKLILSGVLAVVMTYALLRNVPVERFKFSIWVTGAECLVSVFFVYEMIRQVGKANIVSNPLMLFIGVNCLAAITANFLSVDVASLDVVEGVWLGGGVVFGLLTLLSTYLVNKIAFNAPVIKPIDPTGGVAAARTTLRFPMMRAGITPVVYSAFLFFPVMSNFTHHSGTTGLLLSPLWLLGYGILVFVITYSLIKGMVPADVVSEQMRAKGVIFVGDGSDERHEFFLLRQYRKMALGSTIWLCFLMAADAAWQLSSPAPVSSLGIVGGLAPLLLLSISKDLVMQYRTKTW